MTILQTVVGKDARYYNVDSIVSFTRNEYKGNSTYNPYDTVGAVQENHAPDYSTLPGTSDKEADYLNFISKLDSLEDFIKYKTSKLSNGLPLNMTTYLNTKFVSAFSKVGNVYKLNLDDGRATLVEIKNADEVAAIDSWLEKATKPIDPEPEPGATPADFFHDPAGFYASYVEWAKQHPFPTK